MIRVVICLKGKFDPAQPLQPVTDPPGLRPAGEPVYRPGAGGLAAFELAMAQTAGESARITAVSAGGEEARQVLIAALARGADAAIHLPADPSGSETALPAAVGALEEVRSADLILCGDSPGGSFAACLAEGLGRPLVTRALGFRVEGGSLLAERSLERGSRERLLCPLPVVVAVLAHAAQPRYLSVLRLQQAPLQNLRRVEMSLAAGDMGLRLVDLSPARPRPRRMAAPAASMSAAQRMSFLMGGGPQGPAASRDRLFEGSPEQAVERIVQYLKDNGLL